MILAVSMLVKNLFIAFGLCLAALAVIVTVIGMRKEDFPSRKAMIGLIAVGVFLVVGTATYAVRLSVLEAEEREEHKGKEAVGEEASISPVRIPSSIT
jgi:hypothetical protein